MMNTYTIEFSTIAWKHMTMICDAKSLSDALDIVMEKYGRDIKIIDYKEERGE